MLASGKEGTVHIEQVLEYNQDPNYLRDALLYKLTVEAQRRAKASPLSKREIIRRLGTSATQLYCSTKPTIASRSINSWPCCTCWIAMLICSCERRPHPEGRRDLDRRVRSKVGREVSHGKTGRADGRLAQSQYINARPDAISVFFRLCFLDGSNGRQARRD